MVMAKTSWIYSKTKDKMVQRRLWLFQGNSDQTHGQTVYKSVRERDADKTDRLKKSGHNKETNSQTNKLRAIKERYPLVMKRRLNTNNKGIIIRLNHFLLQSHYLMDI